MERLDQRVSLQVTLDLGVADIGAGVLDQVARRAQPVERRGRHRARGPLQVLLPDRPFTTRGQVVRSLSRIMISPLGHGASALRPRMYRPRMYRPRT
jgi:hypothetical protein